MLVGVLECWEGFQRTFRHSIVSISGTLGGILECSAISMFVRMLLACRNVVFVCLFVCLFSEKQL